MKARVHQKFCAVTRNQGVVNTMLPQHKRRLFHRRCRRRLRRRRCRRRRHHRRRHHYRR